MTTGAGKIETKKIKNRSRWMLQSKGAKPAEKPNIGLLKIALPPANSVPTEAM